MGNGTFTTYPDPGADSIDTPVFGFGNEITQLNIHFYSIQKRCPIIIASGDLPQVK
ncbi:hypothetical protein ACMAY4_07130 [Porticoccaceae bacterium nBUS_17]|jgi:hypothetical protein